MLAARKAVHVACAQMNYATHRNKDSRLLSWSIACSCCAKPQDLYTGISKGHEWLHLGKSSVFERMEVLLEPKPLTFTDCPCYVKGGMCDHLWLRVDVFCATCESFAPANLIQTSVQQVHDFTRVDGKIEVSVPLMMTEVVCPRCTRHVKGVCDPEVCRMEHDEHDKELGSVPIFRCFECEKSKCVCDE